jgi:hypothetical protein
MIIDKDAIGSYIKIEAKLNQLGYTYEVCHAEKVMFGEILVNICMQFNPKTREFLISINSTQTDSVVLYRSTPDEAASCWNNWYKRLFQPH